MSKTLANYLVVTSVLLGILISTVTSSFWVKITLSILITASLVNAFYWNRKSI